jgi:hypothetical protein
VAARRGCGTSAAGKRGAAERESQRQINGATRANNKNAEISQRNIPPPDLRIDRAKNRIESANILCPG